MSNTTKTTKSKTTKSKRKVDKEKVKENTINRVLLGKKKLYGPKDWDLAEEIWTFPVRCRDCSILLNYDDSVHYLEDTYLCQICGEGEDEVCQDCYSRPEDCECGGWNSLYGK